MILSRITDHGLRITSMCMQLASYDIDTITKFSHFAVSSFQELLPHIFSIKGLKAFLSEKLNQDPLEKFFGCQKQRGRANENPTAAEFVKNTQALRVINCINVSSITGNYRGTKRKSYDLESSDLSKPLKKRIRKRNKSH